MEKQNKFEDKLKEILAKEGLDVSPGLLTCYTADLMEIAETQLEANHTKLRKMEIKAYDIAAEAFRNKTDKGGVCYFAHISHVCEQVHKEMERNVVDENSTLGLFYQKCCIVALLHDLLEDTGWTAKMLLEKGFDKEVVDAVVAITRRDDEKHYFDFIERVAKNDIAKKVKIYDLEHDMDATRLPKLDETDLDRIKKYWWCREYLLGNVSSVECNNNIHPDRLFR